MLETGGGAKVFLQSRSFVNIEEILQKPMLSMHLFALIQEDLPVKQVFKRLLVCLFLYPTRTALLQMEEPIMEQMIVLKKEIRPLENP